MIAKKQLVCLGMRAWGVLPDRTQQLMAQMKEVEILYFYPLKKGEVELHKKTPRVKENVWVYGLPHTGRNAVEGYAKRSFWQKRRALQIRRIMGKHHFRSALLWLSHPAQGELASFLDYRFLIYDCWYFWDKDLFFSHELLAERADLIFAASHKLKAELLSYQRNVALLENAANYHLFAELSFLAKQERKEIRFGFVGVIEYDLDLEPLLFVAKQRPDWQFMLVGPCTKGNPSLAQLQRCSNVSFFGEHSLYEVPQFLCSCRVLLEFRYCNRPYSDIRPIRLFEYFATGRPVVANLWPEEVACFPDVVYNAYHKNEFLQKCEKALEERHEYYRKRRKNYAKNASWEKRAKEVTDMLSTSGML